MKLLISDYDCGWGFSACSYIPHIGWTNYRDLDLDKICKEFQSCYIEEFAEIMFDNIPECSEIIICQDGGIEIYQRGENSSICVVML